jgi:hypothetical protein
LSVRPSGLMVMRWTKVFAGERGAGEVVILVGAAGEDRFVHQVVAEDGGTSLQTEGTGGVRACKGRLGDAAGGGRGIL